MATSIQRTRQIIQALRNTDTVEDALALEVVNACIGVEGSGLTTEEKSSLLLSNLRNWALRNLKRARAKGDHSALDISVGVQANSDFSEVP